MYNIKLTITTFAKVLSNLFAYVEMPYKSRPVVWSIISYDFIQELDILQETVKFRVITTYYPLSNTDV